MRGCRTARRRLLLQGRVHRGLPRDRTGLTPRGQSLGPVPDDAPMRVPMVGAGGFIGSRIVGGVLLRRRFATCELIACDLAHYDADSWHNVDGLINAAVDCAEPWTLCTRPCAGSCRNTSTSRRRRRRNTSPDQKTGINIGFGRRMGVRTAAMPTSGEQAEGLEGMEENSHSGVARSTWSFRKPHRNRVVVGPPARARVRNTGQCRGIQRGSGAKRR